MQLPANPRCVLVQMQATTLSESGVYRRMRRHAVGDVSLSQIASVPQSVVALLDDVPPTALESTQLQIVHAGTLILDQDGEQTAYRQGDIAVYDVSRPFAFHYPDDFRTTIVQVPTAMLGRPSDRILSGPRSRDSVGSRLLARELRDVATADSKRMLSAARLILTAPTTRPPTRRTLPGHLAAAVRDHVHEHYSDPRLSAASIARHFHVSLRTLFAAFEHEDLTLGALVRRIRLDAAEHLLLVTDLTVADVAETVGYVDTTAFIRVWRSDRGETPARWRRSRRP